MLTVSTRKAGPFAFFIRRWRREVPLGQLFWRDMVVVGSVLNLATGFAALMALAIKADPLVAMLIFHAPLPYNIFIVWAVWRTADLADAARASSARVGAIVWLVAATVL